MLHERTTFDTANVNNNNFDEIESTNPPKSSLPFIDPLPVDSYNMFRLAYDLHCELADPYTEMTYYSLLPCDDIPNHVYLDMCRLFDVSKYAAEYMPSDEYADDRIRYIVFADALTGAANIELWNSDCLLEQTVNTEIMFASDDESIRYDLQQFQSFRLYLANLHSDS